MKEASMGRWAGKCFKCAPAERQAGPCGLACSAACSLDAVGSQDRLPHLTWAVQLVLPVGCVGADAGKGVIHWVTDQPDLSGGFDHKPGCQELVIIGGSREPSSTSHAQVYCNGRRSGAGVG